MWNPISRLRFKVALAIRDVHATRGELAQLRQDVQIAQPAVTDLLREVAELRREMAALGASGRRSGWQTGDVDRIMAALQVIYDEEPENRRRLEELRRSESYELAFTEREPLVSVVVPTHTSWETLRDRAVPSVLAQTYEHWELVVVGDAAPPETKKVLDAFGDSRIRYENLTLRGPYPDDRQGRWLVAGGPPFNAGMRLAKGRWIAPFSDDDALRPQALARNVEEVQKHHWELSYSQIRTLGRDGLDAELNEFPPRLYAAGLQGGMSHAGLRFFEYELADAIFGSPSDWSRLRRMMRAGVRIGFIPEVLCEYLPSYRGEDAASGREGA